MHEYACCCLGTVDDPPLRQRRAGTHSPPFLQGLPPDPSPASHGSICVLQFRPVGEQTTTVNNTFISYGDTLVGSLTAQ